MKTCLRKLSFDKRNTSLIKLRNILDLLFNIPTVKCSLELLSIDSFPKFCIECLIIGKWLIFGSFHLLIDFFLSHQPSHEEKLCLSKQVKFSKLAIFSFEFLFSLIFCSFLVNILHIWETRIQIKIILISLFCCYFFFLFISFFWLGFDLRRHDWCWDIPLLRLRSWLRFRFLFRIWIDNNFTYRSELWLFLFLRFFFPYRFLILLLSWLSWLWRFVGFILFRFLIIFFIFFIFFISFLGVFVFWFRCIFFFWVFYRSFPISNSLPINNYDIPMPSDENPISLQVSIVTSIIIISSGSIAFPWNLLISHVNFRFFLFFFSLFSQLFFEFFLLLLSSFINIFLISLELIQCLREIKLFRKVSVECVEFEGLSFFFFTVFLWDNPHKKLWNIKHHFTLHELSSLFISVIKLIRNNLKEIFFYLFSCGIEFICRGSY